jgi:hypothetical protein
MALSASFRCLAKADAALKNVDFPADGLPTKPQVYFHVPPWLLMVAVVDGMLSTGNLG